MQALQTRKQTQRITPILTLIVGIVLTVIMLFPLYWMVVNSLQTTKAIFSLSVPLVPTQVTFDSYATVLQTQLPHLLTSLIVSVGTAIVSLIIALPAAYALAHFRFRITLFIVFCLLLTQMIPTVTLATPIFLIFSNLGLLNSYTGLIIADTTYAVPFAILILRAFLQSIPPELAQAAYVDGAGEWGAFLRVILPLSIPGAMTAALFAFLFAWSDFLYALTIITTDSIRPISLSIYSYLSTFGGQWNNLMAVATLASIPAAILLIVFQRYIVAGVTSGALKG